MAKARIVASGGDGVAPLGLPAGFLIGASTSAYQVEGNNVNADLWQEEQILSNVFAAASGDAIDHYHRYRTDIALLASLGLRCVRVSVEWSRVEPTPGRYSDAALAHYRDVLLSCHSHGLTPLLALHHWSSPQWFVRDGGWRSPHAPFVFASYCARAMQVLRELAPMVLPLTSLNGPLLLGAGGLLALGLEHAPEASRVLWADKLAQYHGVRAWGYGGYAWACTQDAALLLAEAQQRAGEAIRQVSPLSRVGLSLQLETQEHGDQSLAPFVSQVRQADFVELRCQVGSGSGTSGAVASDVLGTWSHWSQAHSLSSVPLWLHQDFQGGPDDDARQVVVQREVSAMGDVLKQRQLPVRGYVHGAAFDQFEWMAGYRLRQGLVGVSSGNAHRVPRAAGLWLGSLGR